MASRDKAKHAENPRTKRMRDVVLEEGVRLLGSQDGEVTALRISKNTGVSRSAIYRHWPDQSALLLAIVERVVRPGFELSLSGDLRTDLSTGLRFLFERLERRSFRIAFGKLLTHANRDPALVEPQRRFVRGVLLPIHKILEDAVQRGDLPHDSNIEEAAIQLCGPILSLHVMLRGQLTETTITRIVEGFLHSE